MRRRVLVFLIVMDFVLVCGFFYRWGGGLASALGQNLSLKLYNGVLNVYVPGLLCANQEGIPGVYRDVTASVYPAIAENEQKLWYESQEENLAYYENLAAEENEQAKQMIEENKKAAGESGKKKKNLYIVFYYFFMGYSHSDNAIVLVFRNSISLFGILLDFRRKLDFFVYHFYQ